MSEIKFKIVKHIGIIGQSGNWKTELNLVSWNDKDPKFDLRSWDEEHKKMSKGITLNRDEIEKLYDLINEMDV